MKRFQTMMTIGALLVLALLATGCGNASERSSNRVQLGLATDAAYLTVLAAQNSNAAAYSQAILAGQPSQHVAELAHLVTSARNKESKKIEELQQASESDQPTLADAAEQLGYSLSELAITASGQPLAAPATNAGYLKVLSLNDKAGLRASNTETKSGSPGVVPFSRDVIAERTDELAAIKAVK